MNHLSPHDVIHFAQVAIIAAGTVSLLCGFIWITWLIRAFRQDVKRSREGLCMHCGYDLRHSKDRCPECGKAILLHQPGPPARR